MDISQMMLASGGLLSLLIPLLMMLLPLILLLIAWRILKSTNTTAQQVTRLTGQMDELLRHLEEGTLATTGSVGFTMEPTTDDSAQEEDFEFLAANAATKEVHSGLKLAAVDKPDLASGPSTDASEDDETGFEFPGAEDDTFGEFGNRDETDEPVAAAGAGEESTGAYDLGGGEEFSFDLDEQMPGGETFSDSETESVEPGDELGFFTEEPAEAQAPPADAFAGTEETAGESAVPDEDDFRMEQNFDSAGSPADELSEATPGTGSAEQATAEVAEKPPAIIPLEDDPARPEVSLARCGQCAHKLAYKKTLAGKKARCPSCKGDFILP